MQNRAWGLGTPTDLAASNTQDPDLCPLYMRTGTKMRLGGWAVFSQNTDTDTRGRGSQEFQPPVHDERYSLPDIGVCVQGDLKAVIYGQARAGSSRPRSSPRETFEEALKSCGTCG
jgi:hypothetical protein